MARRLVHPEGGLAPQVEVADGVEGVLIVQAGRAFLATTITAAALGEWPADMEGVALAMAFILADLDAFG